MGTYQCSKCGYCLQQPTEPFHCPQCGSQGIGLFRAMPDGGGFGGAPQGGGYRPQQGGFSPNGGYGAPQQGGGYSPNPGGYPTNRPGFGGAPQGGGYPSQQQPSGGFGGYSPQPNNTFNAPGQGGGYRPQQPGFGGQQPSTGGYRPQQPFGGPQQPFGGQQPSGGFGSGQAGYPSNGGGYRPQQPFGTQPAGGMPGGSVPGGSVPGGSVPGGAIRGGFGGMNPGNAANRMPFGGQPQQPQQPFGSQPQQPFGGQVQAPFGGQPQQPFGGQPQQPQQPFGSQPQQPFGGQPQQPQQPFGGQPQQPSAFPSQPFVPQAPVQEPIPQAPVQAPMPQAPVQAPVSQTPMTEPVPQPVPQVPVQPSVPQTPPPSPQPPTQAPMPQRPAQAPVQRPAAQAPVQRPAPQAPVQRPAARPAPRPAPQQQRPAPPRQNFPAPPSMEEAPAKKSKPAPKPGIQVRGKPIPKQPAGRPASANDPKARPRYRAPEPRPQVRPDVDRPERCFWGFPEVPPFTCDAKPMKNAPVLDDKGRLVLVSQGSLYAIDITTPEPEICWEYIIKSHVPGPIVVDAEGDYHLHSADGYLHCVTKHGKQSYMPVQIGEPLGYAAPVVDAWGNTIVSDYNGGLIRVSKEGKKDSRPYFRCRAKLDSSGVIAGETLYIGSEEGYLFAIQLGEVGKNLWDQGAEVGYAGGFLNSSPAVTKDGIIVVATRTEKLMGFLPSGEVAWSTHMPGQLLGSPVIDAYGHIYVGASLSTRQGGQGYLVSVDGNSHKIRWQFQAEEMVECTPVVGDDGTIYFGDNAGWVYAVSPRGDKKWGVRFEAPVRSAGTIVAPNVLAFALDDDVLVGIRCESTDLGGDWPKLGRDNYHSFVGPTPPPVVIGSEE